MRVIPDVNLLRAMRDSGRIDYVLLAGEGIDNAFDAGATNVSVTIGNDEIRFKDNGAGISRDRTPSVLTLGMHGAMRTSRLGRFGVGIKIQALRTGDLFEVRTVSADGAMSAKIIWPDLLGSQDWEISDPHWRPIVVGAPTWTEIAISRLREPPKFSLENLRTQIALRFHPALVAGNSIVLNGRPIDALPEPPMQRIIDRQLALSDGRNAHLRAGMLTAASMLRQVHVAYRHRVIMPASSIGCGAYSGLGQLFARVQLSGPWHLGQFKDDLTDETERRELDETVCEILRPLLEKCQGASLSARLERTIAEINDALPAEIAARPKRTKTTVSAAPQEKRPRSRPGQVAPDKSTPGGPARSKRNRAKLLITFDGNAAEAGIGAFDGTSNLHRVNLSKDNPDIKQFIEQRDHQAGLRALLALAGAIYQHGLETRRDPELALDGTFGERIAKFLAAQDTDAPLAEIAER